MIKPTLAFAALAFAGLFVTGAAFPEAAPAKPTFGAPLHKPDIVMYVMPDCGYCAKARAYLEARGLKWREIDITKSEAANDDFKRRGGVGTPLILIDGSAVQGFAVERIDAALKEPQRE